MIFGNPATVEHELVRIGGVPTHLPVGRLHDEARSSRVDDDVRDLVRRRASGDRDALRHRGTGVGDEGLLAVDDPFTGGIVERGLRLGRARVGSGLGFGEAEAAEHLARDHGNEILLLLGFGTGVEERRRAEADARLERDRHRRVDARDLLDRDAVRQIVGAGAAVLLGKREPEQAQLAHGAHGVDGKRVIAVPVGGVGRDLGLGEVPHHRTELLLFGGGLELHGHDRTRSTTVRQVDARRGYAVVRDGDHWIIGERPARVITARGEATFDALEEIARGGFWVGFVAYDAGRAIEHIDTRTEDDLGLPDLAFVRFDEVRTVDELPHDEWSGCRAVADSVELGRGTSSLTADEHAARVARVHELLAAGECYQVNLTRRLTFDVAPEPIALFSALTRENPAAHAAVCAFGEALPGVAVRVGVARAVPPRRRS